MKRVVVRALAPLLVVLALAGCGGSVADSDGVRATRAPAPPLSPFCSALQTAAAATAPLNGRTGVPPEELSNTVDTVRRANEDLVEAAPGELRTDVERYVAALDLQLAALLANGGDTSALATDPELAAAVNEPENVEANRRVQEYVRRTCGPVAG